MKDQPRTELGQFGIKATEKKGDAIALRLPASLDAEVRAAAEAEGTALRDWVESACKDRVSGAAPTRELGGYPIEQIRAAADRVALTIRPSERLRIQKAFKALLGELLANGD